jgi:hypothetical protein
MSNWGALTDHFGILATAHGMGTLATVLKLKESQKTPLAHARSEAADENGDVAAATWYGAPDTMFEASSTFEVIAGTLSLELLKLGEITSGKIIDNIEVTTDNGAWPTLTVSGRLGCIAVVAPSGKLNTFTLPDIDVVAIKAAQNFGGSFDNGFVVAANTKLTGSSLSFSLDIAETTDGLGVPAAHGVSGGIGVLSADIVSITAAPGWTLDTDLWTQTQAPGTEEASKEYHTGSGTAETVLERDILVI